MKVMLVIECCKNVLGFMKDKKIKGDNGKKGQEVNGKIVRRDRGKVKRVEGVVGKMIGDFKLGKQEKVVQEKKMRIEIQQESKEIGQRQTEQAS